VEWAGNVAIKAGWASGLEWGEGRRGKNAEKLNSSEIARFVPQSTPRIMTRHGEGPARGRQSLVALARDVEESCPVAA
jgi:hypothetical protein